MDNRRLIERPSKLGPCGTSGPVPLMIPQFCTHQPGVKYVQSVPVQKSPLYKRLPIGKLSQPGPYMNHPTLGEAAGPYCFKAHYQHEPKYRVFLQSRPDPLAGHPPGHISPRRTGVITQLPTGGEECHPLPDRAKTAHVDKVLIETAAPNTATLAAIRSVKLNSNFVRPTDGKIESPRPPANSVSDVMLAASFGGSDGDSEYVESTKNHH